MNPITLVVFAIGRNLGVYIAVVSVLAVICLVAAIIEGHRL